MPRSTSKFGKSIKLTEHVLGFKYQSNVYHVSHVFVWLFIVYLGFHEPPLDLTFDVFV